MKTNLTRTAGAPAGRRPSFRCWAPGILALLVAAVSARGQDLFLQRGDPISPDIERIYTRGLRYLAGSQADRGCWTGTRGSEPAVVGLAVLAMLAHGEDPNFGPYSDAIRKGLDFILQAADIMWPGTLCCEMARRVAIDAGFRCSADG